MSIRSFQLMVLLSPIFFLFCIFTDFLFSNSRSPEWDMNGNLSSQPQQRLYVFLFSCLTSCFTYCEICCSVHRMAMSSLWIVLCLVAQSCPTLIRGDSLGKNTGVGCHAILQGIFPIKGQNPDLLYYLWILYCLSHQGSPSKVITPVKWPLNSDNCSLSLPFRFKSGNELTNMHYSM